MNKWVIGIAICVLVVVGILASAVGIGPDIGISSKAVSTFASGITGFGKIISVVVLAILVVLAVVVIVSAIVDLFTGSSGD